MATARGWYHLYVLEDTEQVCEDDQTERMFINEFMNRFNARPHDENRALEICLPRLHFMAGHSVFDCHFDAIAKSEKVLCTITPSNSCWIRHCQQSGYFAKILQDGQHCFIVVFVGFINRETAMAACPNEFKYKDKIIFTHNWMEDTDSWGRLNTTLRPTQAVAPRRPIECSETPETRAPAMEPESAEHASDQPSMIGNAADDVISTASPTAHTHDGGPVSGIVHPSSQRSSMSDQTQFRDAEELHDERPRVTHAPSDDIQIPLLRLDSSINDTISVDGPVSEDGASRTTDTEQPSRRSFTNEDTQPKVLHERVATDIVSPVESNPDNMRDMYERTNPATSSGMIETTISNTGPEPLSVSRSGKIFIAGSIGESPSNPGSLHDTRRLDSCVTTDDGPVASGENESGASADSVEPPERNMESGFCNDNHDVGVASNRLDESHLLVVENDIQGTGPSSTTNNSCESGFCNDKVFLDSPHLKTGMVNNTDTGTDGRQNVDSPESSSLENQSVEANDKKDDPPPEGGFGVVKFFTSIWRGFQSLE